MRFFLCVIFLMLVLSSRLPADNGNNTIYIVPIHDVIDLGLSKFTGRICKEAKANNAGTIVFDINTNGGRIDAAEKICDSIAGLGDIHTAAFINGNAWNLGALTALACKTIVMTPESSIGAEQIMDNGGDISEEKTLADLRLKFQTIAGKNGHSSKLALAMIDKDIELILVKINDEVEILDKAEWDTKDEKYKKKVKSFTTLKEKGKLLNLKTNEAKDLGLAKEVLDTKKDLLEYLDVQNADVIEYKLLWQEQLARFITNPLICSFLLTIGFLGFIFELRLHGWGISGTYGLLAFILFFWAHYFVGLAGRVEIVLFLLGFGFLLIKIFFMERFGIISGAGIIIILISLFLSLIKQPLIISRNELMGAVCIILYSFITSLIIAGIGLKLLPRSHVWKKIIPH